MTFDYNVFLDERAPDGSPYGRVLSVTAESPEEAIDTVLGWQHLVEGWVIIRAIAVPAMECTVTEIERTRQPEWQRREARMVS